jgi:hypothetical protein
LVHRSCLPSRLTPAEYVRMKKNNEVFDFKCHVCFGATQVGVVGRKRKTTKKVDAQPTETEDSSRSSRLLVRSILTETSAKRVRREPEPEPTQQQRSPREAHTRPSAIVLSSRMETRVVVASSTPLDEPVPYVPTQLTVSPIDLPQSIGVSVSVSFNIVITPSDHEQLAEWSSRYDISRCLSGKIQWNSVNGLLSQLPKLFR